MPTPTGRRAPTTTELQRILYARPRGSSTVTWLAGKLKVQRQTCGDWVRGREKIPRRRQLQMRHHLEAPDAPLFDENGFARMLDGSESQLQETPIGNRGNSTYVSPLSRRGLGW